MVISLYVFGYDKNGRLNILANKINPKARGGNVTKRQCDQ
jgi:hypothetical protein